VKIFRAAVFAASGVAVVLPAQVVTLPREIVSAARVAQPAEQVAFSATSFDADTLRAAPTVALDGALRSLPAFTLFRRSDSLAANPTAQGVSLRGLGPSGASRSLVLLDGVPLNDPFGGWVAWTKVPRDGLARAELVPGGGATAWGNAALGGIVQLFTTEPSPAESNPMGYFPTGRVTASAGSFSTRAVEFRVAQPAGRGTVQLLGRAFATNGFSLVAPERRGPVDVAAWSRHRWLAGRWRTPLGENLELTTTARTYEEFRGNGTPYTRNGSREKFFSAALVGAAGKNFAWNTVAYAQDQSFASTFSSVNATRTAETPASDQFAVPATAFGAAWSGAWSHTNGARTSFGGDLRTVRGETRENFTFAAGNFTRQRIAGGGQFFGGVFALHERPLAPDLRATLGARFDDWRETAGHRRETDRATGAVLRDDHYANRDGVEFSPSAGLVWLPEKSWRVRANAQQSFRVPTLNELYRPFRQGTTIVETNPALRTERNLSTELGADFRTGALTLGATVFHNSLRDAVGNLTLARGPGTFPIFGTLAAGNIGRQRLNVDRVRVEGLEFSAEWHASAALSFNAAALFNDATVRRASAAPALVGKQVAQVPRHSAALGATWHAPGGVVFTPRVRWIGRQFEDDENSLRLGETLVADLGARRALTPHLELFLTIENLGNARLETGRSADGVVNVGTPRLALAGLRGHW
jgi:outer membrane receptor protein involved in Fe transport